MTRFNGIKKVASLSKGLKGSYSPYYLEVFYDVGDDVIWADEYYSLGHNQWSVYQDDDIIRVCSLSNPITMKELKELTITAMKRM